jgi:hypothetical protein
MTKANQQGKATKPNKATKFANQLDLENQIFIG